MVRAYLETIQIVFKLKTSSFFSREISRNSTRLDFGTHYLLQRGFLSRLDSVLLNKESWTSIRLLTWYLLCISNMNCVQLVPLKLAKLIDFYVPLALAQLELQFLQQKWGANLVGKDHIWLFQKSLCNNKEGTCETLK